MHFLSVLLGTECRVKSWILTHAHFTLFPPSRGDVLIQSGLLVVPWREVRGLRWVQRHRGPQHRVLLVWPGPVPQHCFHSLSKGGTSRQGLFESNKLVPGSLYCCMWTSRVLWAQTCSPSLLSGVSYNVFLRSQVLPTLSWNCLLWTLTTRHR